RRPDDAATAPDGGQVAGVNTPVVLIGTGLDLVEALGVGHQLGGVQCATDILDEFRLVQPQLVEGGQGTGRQVALCGLALIEGGGQGTGKDGLADAGDGNTEVEGFLDGPATGALLACGVEDDVDKRLAGLGVDLAQDLSGDLDEVGVQIALVPLGEDIGDLGRLHAGAETQQLVGLTDDL